MWYCGVRRGTRICYNTMLYDTVRYAARTLQHGIVRYGVVRCGAIWYGMVRCGAIWYGMVRNHMPESVPVARPGGDPRNVGKLIHDNVKR